HAEWADGEVVLMTPVSRKHQELAGFLLKLIGVLVDARKLGKIFFEPFQMKTGRELPGRAPDILFLSNQNLGRLKDHYLDGPADLVIEIVSPDSRSRDRKVKFKEYQLGGVREYWILDPERRSAEFYQLDEHGKFQSLVPSKEGVVQSIVVPDLGVEDRWFWQDPHPPVLSILKQWNII
ncbi:MAG: Uma2 family endonuclease, partial [Terriglobia bacterium]